MISIKDENEKLKNDNQELKDKVSLYDDVMNLENKKNELTAKIKTYKRHMMIGYSVFQRNELSMIHYRKKSKKPCQAR